MGSNSKETLQRTALQVSFPREEARVHLWSCLLAVARGMAVTRFFMYLRDQHRNWRSSPALHNKGSISHCKHYRRLVTLYFILLFSNLFFAYLVNYLHTNWNCATISLANTERWGHLPTLVEFHRYLHYRNHDGVTFAKKKKMKLTKLTRPNRTNLHWVVKPSR